MASTCAARRLDTSLKSSFRKNARIPPKNLAQAAKAKVSDAVHRYFDFAHEHTLNKALMPKTRLIRADLLW
jgi:hypothetical protein